MAEPWASHHTELARPLFQCPSLLCRFGHQRFDLGLFFHMGVVCFKFMCFSFPCGFNDFSGFMGFGGEWCLDMENVNIAGGGRGMQQEENQCP